MNNLAYAGLDQTELLQLALNAGSDGDPGAAIAYLKEAVSRPDANAIAHYLLGAEYAQSQLYEYARDEMEASIALDPALSIARFQLGLLLVTMNETTRAAMVLGPLRELGQNDPMNLFGTGLICLIDGRLNDAIEALEDGIANNQQNIPLNADMRRLAAEIGKTLAHSSEVSTRDIPAEPAVEGGLHVLLSAYMDNKES